MLGHYATHKTLFQQQTARRTAKHAAGERPLSQVWRSGFFLFHRDGDGARRGQANLVALDIRNQAPIDLGTSLRYDASAKAAAAMAVDVEAVGVREPDDFNEAFAVRAAKAALWVSCQWRKFTRLFYDLVGGGEKCLRHAEAERLCGLEVDGQGEPCGLRDGQILRPFSP
jgi:hypothetical protein